MRLEILLTAFLFFGGTFLSGYAVRHVLKLENRGVLFSIVCGVLFWWASMELILVPMTMLLLPFHRFVLVYSFVVLLVAFCGCLCWREILEDLKNLVQNAKSYFTIGYIIAFLLICYQLYFIHHHMYLEWDDTYYVNLANEAVFSDKIYWIYPETGAIADFDKRYVLSLWPIFYAWLSKLVGVIPTIMAHTILPWIMIPLAYMIYALIGRELFSKNRELEGMFLTFLVLLHLFMSGEHVAGITFLSITPWVGKAVLASILIPALFYWLYQISQGKCWGNWVMLGITCLGGCLLSSMGIMLTPIFVGVAVFLIALYKRSFRHLCYGVLACFPCIVLGLYYLYLTH